MELFRPLLDPYILISLIKQCSMLRKIRQHHFVHMNEFLMDVLHPALYVTTLLILGLVQYLTLVARLIRGLT